MSATKKQAAAKRGTNATAYEPTGMARSMMAMAVNAAGDEVHVAWPNEKAAVETLERHGLVKVRRTNDRCGEFTEWWFRLSA